MYQIEGFVLLGACACVFLWYRSCLLQLWHAHSRGWKTFSFWTLWEQI